MPMARIKEWLEPDKLTLLEGWARDGLTKEQIANNIGIGRTTLFEWEKKEPNIANTLKKGKEVVDIEVENALLKRATGYTTRIREQKLDKDGNVYELERDIYIAPDTTALIFWLKNRQKEKWRDKVESNENENDIQNAKDIVVKIREIANEQRN